MAQKNVWTGSENRYGGVMKIFFYTNLKIFHEFLYIDKSSYPVGIALKLIECGSNLLRESLKTTIFTKTGYQNYENSHL